MSAGLWRVLLLTLAITWWLGGWQAALWAGGLALFCILTDFGTFARTKVAKMILRHDPATKFYIDSIFSQLFFFR